MKPISVERGSLEHVDLLRPIWSALVSHHGARIDPALLPSDPLPEDESWEQQKRQYESALGFPHCYLYMARRADSVAGYAFARVYDSNDLWLRGRCCTVDVIATLPAPWRARVALALVERMTRDARTLDVVHWVATALSSNQDARHLFEFIGGKETYVTYSGLVQTVPSLERYSGTDRPE